MLGSLSTDLMGVVPAYQGFLSGRLEYTLIQPQYRIVDSANDPLNWTKNYVIVSKIKFKVQTVFVQIKINL